ncbi:hypothetical protein ES705_11389 [subsurface metagenome]
MKKYILPLILILLTFALIGYCITYTSQYPPVQSDDYVKATTKYSTIYWQYYATDPAKSLTGAQTTNSWRAAASNTTNQRFHIDLGSAKVIRRIYYENYHHYGSILDAGVQNFTFWGSNTEADFLELTYAEDGTWVDLTLLLSQTAFDEHVGLDQADPKYIVVTNTTAYRYYAFKFADNHGYFECMGVRRIELQTEDAVPDIDIGSAAIDRPNNLGTGNTWIDKTNPANATGKITSIEIWAYEDMSNVEVATFYVVSGDNFSTRGTQFIGNVTAGAKRTFEVDFDVREGDYIGIYWTVGKLAFTPTGGAGTSYGAGDNIPCTDTTFTPYSPYMLSVYGTGEIVVVGWPHKWNTITIGKWNTKEIMKWNGLE